MQVCRPILIVISALWMAGAATAQGELLADIAVHELEAQKQRLGEYEQQARFALASIYDRAAEAPPSSPTATAPAGVQP